MENYQVILFDGVCNFCNFWVNFIMDRDKHNLFRFAALQSETGEKILRQIEFDSSRLDTFILISGGEHFIKSTAALMIAKNLGGVFKLFYPLIFLPKFFRDFMYDLIAKNRYKIFGRRTNCRIPNEDERKKFL